MRFICDFPRVFFSLLIVFQTLAHTQKNFGTVNSYDPLHMNYSDPESSDSHEMWIKLNERINSVWFLATPTATGAICFVPLIHHVGLLMRGN